MTWKGGDDQVVIKRIASVVFVHKCKRCSKQMFPFSETAQAVSLPGHENSKRRCNWNYYVSPKSTRTLILYVLRTWTTLATTLMSALSWWF